MSRWVRYHQRGTVANLLRQYPREVQQWAAGDDPELKRLLGLEAEQQRLL